MSGIENEVLVLMGDGNYQMHPMELITATQEQAKITVVLSVNYGFQSIHGRQKALVRPSLGNVSMLRDTDSGLLDRGELIEVYYFKNAKSVGARAWLAKTDCAIRAALREARDESRPCVIEVPTTTYRFTPDPGIRWDVFGADVTNDPKTAKLVAEREAGRAVQRFYH